MDHQPDGVFESAFRAACLQSLLVDVCLAIITTAAQVLVAAGKMLVLGSGRKARRSRLRVLSARSNGEPHALISESNKTVLWCVQKLCRARSAR
jgi:hypothetical protein